MKWLIQIHLAGAWRDYDAPPVARASRETRALLNGTAFAKFLASHDRPPVRIVAERKSRDAQSALTSQARMLQADVKRRRRAERALAGREPVHRHDVVAVVARSLDS